MKSYPIVFSFLVDLVKFNLSIVSGMMATDLIMTLSRDFDFGGGNLDMAMTPTVKKDLTSLFIDDDSGLGMDDNEEQTTPSRTDGLSSLDFSCCLTFDDTSEKVVKHARPIRRITEIRRPLLSGKRKLEDADDNTPSPKSQKKSSLRRVVSFDEKLLSSSEGTDVGLTDDVIDAVNRLVDNEDLTGDGARTFCLPTVRGKHQDLKSITPQTLAEVLNGKYENIGSCRIIDCRYPYEYDGGHIQGAENLYTKEMVTDLLRHHKPTNQEGKRDILVFHCEFSSERGPKMSRFLRAQDRELNKHQYPALTYPEVYLLHGGYKAFFESDDNKTLCQPIDYTPMVHQEHTDDLRHFRSRSKSWTARERRRNALKLHF